MMMMTCFLPQKEKKFPASFDSRSCKKVQTSSRMTEIGPSFPFSSNYPSPRTWRRNCQSQSKRPVKHSSQRLLHCFAVQGHHVDRPPSTKCRQRTSNWKWNSVQTPASWISTQCPPWWWRCPWKIFGFCVRSWRDECWPLRFWPHNDDGCWSHSDPVVVVAVATGRHDWLWTNVPAHSWAALPRKIRCQSVEWIRNLWQHFYKLHLIHDDRWAICLSCCDHRWMCLLFTENASLKQWNEEKVDQMMNKLTFLGRELGRKFIFAVADVDLDGCRLVRKTVRVGRCGWSDAELGRLLMQSTVGRRRRWQADFTIVTIFSGWSCRRW